MLTHLFSCWLSELLPIWIGYCSNIPLVKGYGSVFQPLGPFHLLKLLLFVAIVSCSVKLIQKVWEITVWAEVALATSCTTHQLLHGSLFLFWVLGSYFRTQRERERKKWSLYLIDRHPSGCEQNQQLKIFSELIFPF